MDDCDKSEMNLQSATGASANCIPPGGWRGEGVGLPGDTDGTGVQLFSL